MSRQTDVAGTLCSAFSPKWKLQGRERVEASFGWRVIMLVLVDVWFVSGNL